MLATVQQDWGFKIHWKWSEGGQRGCAGYSATKWVCFRVHSGRSEGGQKEVVLATVQQNGSALQFTAKGLKGDKEVVLAVVQQNGYALEFAAKGGQRGCAGCSATRWVCFRVHSGRSEGGQRGCAGHSATKWVRFTIRSCGRSERGDKEVVLAAVQQDGNALKYAFEILRSDKEVVVAAVMQSPIALNSHFMASIKIQIVSKKWLEFLMTNMKILRKKGLQELERNLVLERIRLPTPP